MGPPARTGPMKRLPWAWPIATAACVLFCLRTAWTSTTFLNLDDDDNFGEPNLLAPSWDSVPWAFSDEAVILGVHEPISLLFRLLVRRVFLLVAPASSLMMYAKAVHLASMALHALAACLAWVVTVDALRLLDACAPPATTAAAACSAAAQGTAGAVAAEAALARRCCAAAACFVVLSHPARVEVVAWCSCQPYLLCTVFSLLALVCCTRHWRRRLGVGGGPAPVAKSRTGPWSSAALCFAALAMGSKAAAAPLPALVLLVDAYVDSAERQGF